MFTNLCPYCSFQFCEQILDKSSLEKKTFLQSQSLRKSSVWGGIQAGATGGVWSHDGQTQEAGQDKCWYSALYLFYIQVWTPACELVPSRFKVVLPLIGTL